MKKKRIIIGAIFVIAVFLTAWLLSIPHRNLDMEFNAGSKIELESLEEIQIENLQKLCKVWGFAKYYHPKVISGSVNWDYELFRVLPKVIEEKDEDKVNAILYDWLIGFGDIKKGIEEQTENKEVLLKPDTAWIENEQYLSEKLSDFLVKLSNTNIRNRKNAYANFNPKGDYVEFVNEEEYPNMKFEDDGYRMLGLFRYWNIVQYYNPYIAVTGENWDEILKEFIPKFAVGEDDLSYKLAIAELSNKIHDSHISISDISGTWNRYMGTMRAPIHFLAVEDKIIITGIAEKYKEECTVKVGDIVKAINGKPIEEVILEKGKYLSFSRDTAIVNTLKYYLFATSEESLRITVEREGTEIDEIVKCYSGYHALDKEKESHKLLEENIGYIDPSALKKGEIETIMGKFMDTAGMIVDLRYYPSDPIMYTLGSYLVPDEEVFAKITFASQTVPGEFVLGQDMLVGTKREEHYKGKVIILMNECSQSQSEFTIMALRKAPKAQVIGTPSIGADGNVVAFVLPGGVRTRMTGLGVYNPDLSETQRVGLTPDILVEPTIQGIKEGRDELIEKGIALIKE